MTPAVVWLLLENDGLSLTAAALFAAASLTDLADGRLARRWKVESVFGTLADTFADKLLVLGSLVALASAGRVPVWVVAVIGAREVWVTLLRTYARRRGVVIAAGPFGKAKMVVQVFVVLSLIALEPSGAALYVPLYAMVAITIASGVELGLRAHRRTAAVPARARIVAGAS
jgi:CDP-diacylglycerol---glycerol-3-phosphate 3-phosphatidyltransferase